MKLRTLAFVLLAGILLLGCSACSSQAIPAAPSKPTESMAMASASPTPAEIIQVVLAEPVKQVTRNDTCYFDNCSGTEERRQFLSTLAQVQKSLTLGSEATATESGQKTTVSEECRARLMAEIEKAYQDKLAAAQAKIEQNEAEAQSTTSNPPAAVEMALATRSSTPTPSLPDENTDPFPSKSDPMTQIEWGLRHKKPAMILFHSTLCRPCRMMDALVQMVRYDYEPAVVFIEVIIDNPANADLVSAARIGSIPASLFVNRSGQIKRVIGLMKQQDLRAELARLMGEE